MNSSSSGSAPKHVETTSLLHRSFSRRISSNKPAISGGAPTCHFITEFKTCQRDNNRFCYGATVTVSTNSYLLALDVGLKEARVLRVRGDFRLHHGGRNVVLVSGGGGFSRREEVVGSEHRNPVCCGRGHEEAVVVCREDQILRRHQRLVGVLRRGWHSVHFVHNRSASHFNRIRRRSAVEIVVEVNEEF